MDKVIIPIVTFVLGYYIKHLFDTRDLRRQMLQKEFEKFEKAVVYLQTEWRNIELRNISDGKMTEFWNVLQDGKDSLKKAKSNMTFCCNKIGEKKLIPLIDEGFAALNEAIGGYWVFAQLRDNSQKESRKEAIDMVKEANCKFDEILPIAMEKVYHDFRPSII